SPTRLKNHRHKLRSGVDMSTPMAFADPRLETLDGFDVQIDRERERADIILDRPPFNIIEMPQRDQLRLAFEALDNDAGVRIIVLRAIGEHFSSGGNIKGFLEATPEHVSKLAWNIAAPARCSKPVIGQMICDSAFHGSSHQNRCRTSNEDRMPRQRSRPK